MPSLAANCCSTGAKFSVVMVQALGTWIVVQAGGLEGQRFALEAPAGVHAAGCAFTSRRSGVGSQRWPSSLAAA